MSDGFPDYFEKLVGYRSWTVSPEGLLYGIANRTLWEPGEPLKATCHKTESIVCQHCGEETVIHPCPQLKCTCGIHAFGDAVSYMNQLAPTQRWWTKSTIQVDGACRIWGRAILHKNGFRAEYGEVALLCTKDADLCKRYGAEQFPGTFFELVKHLRGE